MKIATVFFCLLIFISSVNVAVSLSIPNPLFEVYTVEDLKSIESNSCNVKLMNDLEITDEVWKPIGQANHPFDRTFDGNNYTITFKGDVRFEHVTDSQNEGYGLFGYVHNGRIRNLNVVFQGNLTSFENNTGTLVGIVNKDIYIPFSEIFNCSVSSEGYSISGKNNVGGLAGHVINGSIENSSSDCSVIAIGNNAGGLVGSASHGTILSSSASGDVKSVENAGALIGYISNETTISNSSADGAVKPKGAFGNFIGDWAEDYKPTVLDCFYQETEVDLESVPIGNDEKATKTAMAAIMSIVLLAIVIVIIYSKKRN